MNLDELMTVWQSQRANPRQSINETLLRLALKQDEAKLLAERRRERWQEYLGAALLFGVFAVFLAVMIYRYDGGSLTGWDFSLPIIGAAVAVLSGHAMYVRHRDQALREQNFDDSLRDQINRQIVQLDFWATRVHRTRIWRETLLAIGIVAVLTVVWGRINDRLFSDVRLWRPIAFSAFGSVVWLAVSFRRSRRRLQQEILPRRHRLEALRRELDGE